MNVSVHVLPHLEPCYSLVSNREFGHERESADQGKKRPVYQEISQQILREKKMIYGCWAPADPYDPCVDKPVT